MLLLLMLQSLKGPEVSFDIHIPIFCVLLGHLEAGCSVSECSLCSQLESAATSTWQLQEVKSYRPAIRPERRRQMQQEAEAAAPHALQILASCLNQKGVTLVAAAPV